MPGISLVMAKLRLRQGPRLSSEMSILNLPMEILVEIALKIENPQDYNSFCRTCCIFRDIGAMNYVQSRKKAEWITVRKNSYHSTTYLRNKKHGREQWFYPGNRFWLVIHWKNGHRHGLSSSWYQNGKLEKRCNWSHGLKHGLEEHYYETGEKQTVTHWYQGKRHGLEINWLGQNKLQSITLWHHGVRVELDKNITQELMRDDWKLQNG